MTPAGNAAAGRSDTKCPDRTACSMRARVRVRIPLLPLLLLLLLLPRPRRIETCPRSMARSMRASLRVFMEPHTYMSRTSEVEVEEEEEDIS